MLHSRLMNLNCDNVSKIHVFAATTLIVDKHMLNHMFIDLYI